MPVKPVGSSSSASWLSEKMHGSSSTNASSSYLPLAHSSNDISSSTSSSCSSSSGSDRAGSPTLREKAASLLSPVGLSNGSVHRHRLPHRHRDSSSSDSTLVPPAAAALLSPSMWAEKSSELFKDGCAVLSSYGVPMDFWTIVRKLFSIVIQGGIIIGILAFAIYGGYMFITMRWSGRYMRIPVYTKYEIGQAGWQRPFLVPSNPPSSLNHPNPLITKNVPQPTAAPANTPKDTPSIATNSKTQLQLYDFDAKVARADGRKNIEDLHILVLTPLKNAMDTIDKFFSLLADLEHPKENMSLGFLIGDEEDETGKTINEWVGNQTAKGDYRKISLLKKDFGIISPGGDARHKNWLQAQRRSLMAKARTLLLTSTLEPSVDWVLWLDSDLTEAPKSLIADLLFYGHAGVYPDNYDNMNSNSEDVPPLADIVTPNIMRRLGPGQIQGYDLNNWAETPQSLRMKAKLPADRILHEGQQNRPTYRALLARSWVPPNITSTWNDNSPYFPYMPEIEGPTDLYDPESDAYIGRTMDLDGIGGVATLVRADTHRFGAIFPSWVQDHQVETEGFGVLAKSTGARIVGLPNYLVYHHFAEYGMLGI